MTLKNGWKLQWGTYAMFLYCEKNNCDLSGLLEQLANLQVNIKTVILMVQAAYSAENESELSSQEVAKWIDSCGGIFAQEGELIDFINHVVKNTVVKESQPIEGEEEKKS